ncbi:MAG: metal ABC transporter ATP-binding protein [Gloeobacterales cyanobacterium]
MLQIRDLTVKYGNRVVLENITFTLPSGRLVGVIGPNGAGKSTLIKAIMGMVPMVSGRVELGGIPIKEIRERVAYVPQRAGIDWDFPATVKDVVLMGCIPYMGWLSRPQRVHYDLVQKALERVSMQDFSDRRIGELSGGQQQRVFIARALVQEAELYLFDEPFVGVDQYTEQEILKIFDQLRSQGKSLMVINHDLGEVIQRYDDILMLRGKITAYGPRNQVFTQENLNKAYMGQVALV